LTTDHDAFGKTGATEAQ